MASVEIQGQDWTRIHIDSLSDQDLEDHIDRGEELLVKLEATLNDSNISSQQKGLNKYLIDRIKKLLEEAKARLLELRDRASKKPSSHRPKGIKPG